LVQQRRTLLLKKDVISESGRLAMLFGRMRPLLENWGYREVFLPTVERDREPLKKGLKTVIHNEVYRVGADITSQVLASLKQPGPCKLFYFSETLESSPRGTWQAGAEWLNGPPEQSGVEMLSMVITLLQAIGIHDFFIDLGSLKGWESVISHVPEQRETIWHAIHSRNFGLIEDLDISPKVKEQLWNLFHYRRREANLPTFQRIMDCLADERVFMDYGSVRFLPYYENLVFEVYSPELAFPLGGGGEYRVNGNHGFGFALDAAPLLSLASSVDVSQPRKLRGPLQSVYQQARELVLRGQAVEVETCD